MERDVDIELSEVALPGRLALPVGSASVVVFAHGSGSSRLSPRNTRVASILNGAGHGTLLFDLLVEPEARNHVFDIDLLAARLTGATHWLSGQPEAEGLKVGYFGASTGAAAALRAAADLGKAVAAIVSRGGRPDLAGPTLGEVLSPTLLIVGSEDPDVLALNQEAARRLTAPHRLEVVDGAGHLFEEPGALETVAGLARAWCDRYLTDRIP